MRLIAEFTRVFYFAKITRFTVPERGTVQCSAVQCSAVQCSAVQCVRACVRACVHVPTEYSYTSLSSPSLSLGGNQQPNVYI